MSEPKKVDVNMLFAYRLIHPRNVILVSCVDPSGKANIITLAWSMPLSRDPPLVGISIAPGRYSHKLIEETKEFVVNVPTMEIVKETLYCGRVSGRSKNKFKEAKLTPLPAKKVKAPLIRECVAHLECRLTEQLKTGDHTLFIGEIVAAYANEGVFTDRYDLSKVKPIYHVGEDEFATLESQTVVPSL